MSEFANLGDRLPGILRALAVGIPAGYLFDLLQTPIPWMIGPMIGVAALNLCGVRMHSPPLARQAGQNQRRSGTRLLHLARRASRLAGARGATDR